MEFTSTTIPITIPHNLYLHPSFRDNQLFLLPLQHHLTVERSQNPQKTGKFFEKSCRKYCYTYHDFFAELALSDPMLIQIECDGEMFYSTKLIAGGEFFGMDENGMFIWEFEEQENE
ncbi:hypothetical protein PLEI_1447 [Photobacterium leiognathi lrivu.4.1]|uniref:Uncharacterized protein n=1 Tax=Photobacterium leiognathi lrivu.4.1 TaxID=1248232 RepID=A0A0U1P615_PHOLE|nr:hypothetical protein [Photobacterium leiognathi]GAD29794.1 hypothetical protein PLEI_1447 [Photobacterium leiognathi lrivu.4.1]